jgi:hypothetical protein
MKTIIINHHDSLGIPIIHTNMPRSDPSKYISMSLPNPTLYALAA